MAQVTEYVSPYMLLYDDKILHFWKVFLHGCCSFQCYCCFTISECHVPTTNNMPYYTMSVWHVEECRHIQVRCIPLLIAPSATESYYSVSVWYVEVCRHMQVRPPPPTYSSQCYRAVLHHVSLTCGRIQMYPGQMYTPTHWTQSYRVLLHHVSLICGRMQIYPGQTFLPQYTCELT